MSSPISRRNWIASASALAAGAPKLQPDAPASDVQAASGKQPNILLVISDQFRGDFLGCLGHPMNLTPNIDDVARHGVLFRHAVSSQPVCAPARAVLLTGQYPSRSGVWRNGLGLTPGHPTVASILREHGYAANFIGKWHLAPGGGKAGSGPVPPQYRGGFADFWEGANALELVSHPFEGEMYDTEGKPLKFSGEYRADFLTDRAIRFLKQERGTKPFLLAVSYLEVHHQNDIDRFVPPKKYENSYRNPFVPQDLRPLPGSWPSQLADYCGCVKGIDDCVGILMQTLRDEGLDSNTIVLFTSDHACHFKTRNAEYKRSPHESSIHIPLVMRGPGLNRSIQVNELVSHVDMGPSLLELAGVPIPSTMQGRSFIPLLSGSMQGGPQEAYIEMSEFMTGRILRTPQYTYAVASPSPAAASDRYFEYMLYDNFADPFQHVNLVGRKDYRDISDHLRERLLARIADSSGLHPSIEPTPLPYIG